MIKIVSFGDGLFHSRSGYGSLLHPQLICADPSAPFDVSIFSSEVLTFRDVLEQVPLHVIGKAPNYVFLGLGYQDIVNSSLESIGEALKSLISLIKDKTQSRLVLANLCTVFFSSDEQIKSKCNEYNKLCSDLCGRYGAHLADFNAQTYEFLEIHRIGKGQKMSLHTEGPRLTTLGVLFISRIAAAKILEVHNLRV